MHRYGYCVVGIIAVLLYFIAIGYHGWNCSDSILGPNCIKFNTFKVTGALLITTAFILLIGVILAIIGNLNEDAQWARYGACAVVCLSAIFSIAAIFYYFDRLRLWSPFIATIAMALTIGLAIMLIFDVLEQQEGGDGPKKNPEKKPEDKPKEEEKEKPEKKDKGKPEERDVEKGKPEPDEGKPEKKREKNQKQTPEKTNPEEPSKKP